MMFVVFLSSQIFDFDLATLSHPGIAVGHAIMSHVACFLMYLNGGAYMEGENTLNEDGKKICLKFQEALHSFC